MFAHVESGHDFHAALDAGVDVIAHLPGSDQPAAIDPADAQLAAKRGVILMTTTVLIEEPTRDDRRPALRDAQIANLRALRDAGVTLAAGSDEFQVTSSAEIAYLRKLGVFSDAELLRMWTTNCARVLFPGRRVGSLEPGNEASFLVLGSDPLRKLRCRAQYPSAGEAGREARS